MAHDKKDSKSSRRGGLWILIVAAVVLEATACIQYFYSRSVLREEAEKRAKTELLRAELEIEKHTIEMETAAKMLAMLAEKHVDCPDSIFAATRAIVATLENTSSVAVAYVPGYFSEQLTINNEYLYFEACSSRVSEDSIYTRQIGSKEHDYTQMEWFQSGLEKDSCWWCEPYLDDSGSRTYVVSCSYPVRKNGEVVAVVCVDLSLDYLQQVSEYLQMYPGSYYSIRSSTGNDIVAHPDTVAGRKYEIYDEEIDATGWHISIIIPEDVIFADLKKVGLIVSILMLLGLAVLIFIMYRTGKNLVALMNLSSRQERMESELNIARKIQMAMLPTRFPPFPDYPNLHVYGEVIPAKEVGGDLFDFYIRDNKMLFCIGDVSGKGVPASLVMAMTRSSFRSFTSYIDSPATIVTQMNNSLSGEGNDEEMFVTLFLGVLDLQTGVLKYCNAGHNAPLYLPFGHLPFTIDCKANLPLGILAGFVYEEQETTLAAGDTLFLYTDGLSEAENVEHAQFGEERIGERLAVSGERAPLEIIEDMRTAVQEFAGEAEQSDDLTMMAIRCQKSDVRSQKSEGAQHFSLVMRNDIKQIPTLAEWVETIGIPEALNMPINLALEEAVSNVMLYAYPGQSGRVLVEAYKTEKEVRFTITDSGIPFDPTQKGEVDITQSAEERAIGGLGIHLVRQIMDEISYERSDEKNVLTLVKTLNC